MNRLAILWLSIPLSLGACAGPRPASTASGPASAPPPSAAAPEPPAAAGAVPPPPAAPQPNSPPAGAAVQAAPKPVPPRAAPRSAPVAARESGASAPKPAVAAPKPASAAPAANKVAAPASHAAAPAKTLDLAALEQRLKDTRAIGLFTKLSLKNQVDDLLAQFRAVYNGKANTPLEELHQRYDLLLLKVLSLLQDSDPPLAADIAASRQAIWSILADPKKFSSI